MVATTDELFKLNEYFSRNTTYAKKLLEGYIAPRQGETNPTYNLNGLSPDELIVFNGLWKKCYDTQKNGLIKSFFKEFSGEEESIIDANIDVYRKTFDTNILNHVRWNSLELHDRILSLVTRKHADNIIERSLIQKFTQNIDIKQFLRNDNSKGYFNECLTQEEREEIADMVIDNTISDLYKKISTKVVADCSSIEKKFINLVKAISSDKNLNLEYLNGFDISKSTDERKSAFIAKIKSFVDELEHADKKFTQALADNDLEALKAALESDKRMCAVSSFKFVNSENICEIFSKSSYNEDFRNEYLKYCADYMHTENSSYFNPTALDFIKIEMFRIYENACYKQSAKTKGFRYNAAETLDEIVRKFHPKIIEEVFSKENREKLDHDNKSLPKSSYHRIINKTIDAKAQLDMLAVIDSFTEENNNAYIASQMKQFDKLLHQYPKGIDPNQIIPAYLEKSHDSIYKNVSRVFSSKSNKQTLAQTIDSILKKRTLTNDNESILQEFIQTSFILFQAYKPNTKFNKITANLLKRLDFSGSEIKTLDLSGSKVEELDLGGCKSLISLTGIPTSLKKLNLTWSNIKTLDLSGSKVEELDLKFCKSLTSLTGIPTSLKKLDLNYSGIQKLDLKGSNVEELDLWKCKSLTSLSNLPTSLKKLDLSGSNIKTLDLIGSKVEELDLRNCESLTSLSNLPTSLKKLDLDGCESLASLSGISTSLKKLNLKWSKIQTLDLKGSKVEELDLKFCKSLTSLTDIPTSLKKLNLTGSKIQTLDLKGSKVKELDLQHCESLTSLSGIPTSLKKLNLKWSNIQTLDLKGSKVEELDLEGYKSLTSLSGIPTSLKKLNLKWSKIQTLDLKGSNVEELNLVNCQNLTNLSGLPYSIKTIDLTNCDNLVATPELLEELADLENNHNTLVFYPKHFNKEQGLDKAEARLENAITAYAGANINTAKPNQIKTLMHRFLTENVGQRGVNTETRSKEAFLELLVMIEPFLKLLEENPNHLKWAEQTASVFLDGCVNQPVAGWSEISAWTSVASVEGLENKIEATKHLMVLDMIIQYIARKPPGEKVEVEAGNVLLREVHKKLLEKKDIESPWLGVPKSVAYEGSIRSWLTEGLIEEAYNQAKAVLSQERSVLVTRLCETNYKDNWMQIAFPDESAQIEADYAKKEELLSDAIDKLEDDKAAEIEADLKTALPECYNEKGTLKTLSELNALYQNLPVQKETEISKTVRKLSETSVKEASTSILERVGRFTELIIDNRSGTLGNTNSR